MTAIGVEGEAWLAPGVSTAAANRRLNGWQWLSLLAPSVVLAACLIWFRQQTLSLVHLALVLGFLVSACSKLVLAALARTPERAPEPAEAHLPHYTILAPLYREAEVAAQLVRALTAIDYPADRVQAVLILEREDRETLDALAWLALPSFIEVLIKPPGGPRTKPNALNAALVIARGELITVYDAEDIPHPGQLREAAARFADDRHLVCVQAPLRVGNPGEGFLARQFALEYAGQFDGVMPGIARFGAPFPLGGTSNHFRAAALRRAGGWDPYNVTEDADLGLRLGGMGGKLGVIAAPTREDAPTRFRDWLPQRARWVKGYVQTWGVHMRSVDKLGLKGFLVLQLTLGAAIMGAALHGPLVAMLAFELVRDLLAGAFPAGALQDVSVLALGWGMATMANAVGATRAGLKVRLTDALASLVYWPLQTLAFGRAVGQLAADPYRWDKTPHRATEAPALDEPAPGRVSPAA